jgi:hypothetical protein
MIVLKNADRVIVLLLRASAVAASAAVVPAFMPQACRGLPPPAGPGALPGMPITVDLTQSEHQ